MEDRFDLILKHNEDHGSENQCRRASRDGSEYIIPLVPMDIPSDTPMVLNWKPYINGSWLLFCRAKHNDHQPVGRMHRRCHLSLSTSFFTSSPKESKCMLQGLP